MKFRQWLIAIGLLILVLAAVIASILTRNLGAPESFSSSESVTDQTQLVDEHPLQTARAMAKLASNSDEQRVAAMAVQFADNEVDLAFHDALRDAADHPPQNSLRTADSTSTRARPKRRSKQTKLLLMN